MNRGVKNSDSIPIDLILEIFSRLPAESVARFRCVSKLWNTMLRCPYFTELFLTMSRARPRLLLALVRDGEWSFFSSPQPRSPYEKSSLVVGACFHVKLPEVTPYLACLTSGLIYLPNAYIPRKIGEGDEEVPLIFNPRTGQYATARCLYRPPGTGIFLGFDPIDKQFKALSMASGERDGHRILTLRSGEMTWRKIQCPFIHYPWCQRICINGVLYYFAEIFGSETPDDETSYEWSCAIVCFDVRSEKFKLIDAECYYDNLINYKGKLGGIKWMCGGNVNTFELWVWVLEDVEKQEWSKHIYTLPDNELVDFRYLSIFGTTAKGEILLSMNFMSKPFYVFFFNFGRNTLHSFEIQGLGEYYEALDEKGRHRVFAFVDHVEDLDVNDAKYLKSRAKA